MQIKYKNHENFNPTMLRYKQYVTEKPTTVLNVYGYSRLHKAAIKDRLRRVNHRLTPAMGACLLVSITG